MGINSILIENRPEDNVLNWKVIQEEDMPKQKDG
jgi:hypothetical protein